MSFKSHVCPLLAAVALTPVAAIAADTAEGAVNFEETSWTVADGMAYHRHGELKVVLAESTFDRARMRADGKIDIFDFMRHEGNSLTLNFEDDGPTMCIDYMASSEGSMKSGSSCNSDFQQAITVSARSAGRIAGAMQWQGDDDEKIAVRFDVAIEGGAGGEVARAGQPLAADGGEPGKAVKAHFDALAGGDWKRFKDSAHPDKRAMMDESEQAGDHLEMFEFLREMSPKNVRITGGVVDGDSAQVDFEAEEEGQKVQGTAELVRHEGRWYLQGTSVRN